MSFIYLTFSVTRTTLNYHLFYDSKKLTIEDISCWVFHDKKFSVISPQFLLGSLASCFSGWQLNELGNMFN